MSEEKKKPHISPERMDRFTWFDGDLKFLTVEEFEKLKQSGGFIDYGVSDKNFATDRKE